VGNELADSAITVWYNGLSLTRRPGRSFVPAGFDRQLPRRARPDNDVDDIDDDDLRLLCSSFLLSIGDQFNKFQGRRKRAPWWETCRSERYDVSAIRPGWQHRAGGKQCRRCQA
jgi:hypothetical protein